MASAARARKSISQIFFDKNVQKLLTDITRFDESKLFARVPVPRLKSPKLMFMSDEQLKRAKEDAYHRIQAKLQMPPVLEANESKPKVLARDKELVGYSNFKIMFVDIGPGYSNRSRLMSVREPDGTLRYPTHEERSRMNHIFFPDDSKSIDEPKLFEKDNLDKVLRRAEYVYLLDRACVQYEPDDPRYVRVTSQVYDYISEVGDFEALRSTRHFGPMTLYLIYNKKHQRLLDSMRKRKLSDDVEKLKELYRVCHGQDDTEGDAELVMKE